MAGQHWDEASFCESYSSTWEISEDEVHYGWLAPGEQQLQLIDIDLSHAKVLDIGCGMGENLIALARKGASCHGIDISGHMLSAARGKIDRYGDEIEDIHLQQQDMRQTDFFPGVTFDLILSVYSLEYLESTRELKDLFFNLFQRLKAGGVFLFCFSHQLQHQRHNMLANSSSKTGAGEFSTLIYSFRDVVAALSEVGFVIERVVEQGTRNPSRLSYEEACAFPYHFARDRNPCLPQFDAQSNQVPHTVIFKVRKLDSHGLAQDQQLNFNYSQKHVSIWGQKRTITETRSFHQGRHSYHVHRLAPKDSVVGLCEVLSFQVSEASMAREGVYELQVNLDGSPAPYSVPANALQTHLHEQLIAHGLQPIYAKSQFPGREELETGLYIKRLEPLYGPIASVFHRQQLGILVFLNGEEPAQGTIGLDDITVTPGDHIQVVYIATRWGKQWRPGRRPTQQMDLF